VTPQSHFTVVAPVVPGRERGLRELLATMNLASGRVDAHNDIVPFGRFDRLHVARFAILGDSAMTELESFGLPHVEVGEYLAFIGDCDGPLRPFLRGLVDGAGDGLRRLFSHCEGFAADGDLLEWMLARNQTPAASYVNRIGRTVRQVREESALQRALSAEAARRPAARNGEPQCLRRDLVDFARSEMQAGRLTLTPPEPTPLGWRLREAAHAVAVPLAGLAALPFLIVLSPWLLYLLRTREKTDPELDSRPDAGALEVLQNLEDHDVTNQFTAVGAVKPGRFRRWTLSALLVGLDYGCRHIYHSGHLTRVQTIHFAHWVFLDDKRRLVFASNYDGSLESYMDDFINKVAWGLNLVFSNGVGYPRTDWLVKHGARNELRFKYYLRCHQQPTEVWYKAYPGLTVIDIERNRRIRRGLERAHMTDSEAIAWSRLL
jgi:hypothetical protein